MKKIFSLFACLAIAFIAQTLIAQTKINLDEDWKFHFGHAANPEKDFNYGIANIFSKSGAALGTAIQTNFDDNNWQKINLPHDWAVALPFVDHKNFDVAQHGYKPVGGLFPETSIGWYRKKILINAADSGKRFELQFDGVFRNATVWVNGFFVGQNASGYIGVNYDITDVVQFDKENVIVVRVDATQYEGWFYEGAGIYRHVWLNIYDNLHIPAGGSFVYTNLTNNQATVFVETDIQNSYPQTTLCSISSTLIGRDGKIIATTVPQQLTLAAYQQQKNKQSIKITNPHLWNLQDPYLYRVTTTLKINQQIAHQQTTRIGIRTIRFDANEGVFLNGQYLKILGTNNHQDHAGVGSALPDNLQFYRIRLLKNMGVNAYRTSHHAPTPELLDACDSLGMLVLDETRLLNSSIENLQQFERLLKRDRNHPSVFLWSIGNEEGWIQANSTGKRIAQTFIAKQHQLDPTRTCTYAADLGNVYNGINEVIPIRSFNYRHNAVAEYHRDHPNQPILGTEMGSTVTTRGEYTKDETRAYVPDQDITAPWWASTAEAWWKPAAENK
ncbi:MAG: hypothetical protein RLY16_371, partial [Bacteroidota bacterium]